MLLPRSSVLVNDGICLTKTVAPDLAPDLALPCRREKERFLWCQPVSNRSVLHTSGTCVAEHRRPRQSREAQEVRAKF